MTAVNAGRVELDIVAVAKDQVSATLREVNASLAGTKAQMEGVKQANGSVAESNRGLYASLKPTFQLQEQFNKILGLGGFIGIVTGAVVGLKEIIDHFDGYARSMAVVKEHQRDFNALLSQMVEINRRNAEAQLDKGGQWEAENGKQAVDRASKSADLAGHLAEKQMALIDGIQKEVRLREQIAASVKVLGVKDLEAQQAERRVNVILIEREGLLRDIAYAQKQSTEAMQDQAVLLVKSMPGFYDLAATTATIATNMALAFSPVGNLTGVKPLKPTTTPTPRGGSPVDLLAEWKQRMADLAGKEVPRGAAAQSAEERRLMRRLAKWSGWQPDMEAPKEALTDTADAVAALASEYDRLGSSIGALSGPLGMLTSELGTVAQALGNGLTAAARFTSGDILGGLTSVIGGIVDLFGGTAKRAHAIARDAQADLNKTSTIVYNIRVAPGTDPQSVARSLRQTEYASRGTGQRAGGV
jgi:hypothetical protein